MRYPGNPEHGLEVPLQYESKFAPEKLKKNGCEVTLFTNIDYEAAREEQSRLEAAVSQAEVVVLDHLPFDLGSLKIMEAVSEQVRKVLAEQGKDLSPGEAQEVVKQYIKESGIDLLGQLIQKYNRPVMVIDVTATPTSEKILEITGEARTLVEDGGRLLTTSAVVGLAADYIVRRDRAKLNSTAELYGQIPQKQNRLLNRRNFLKLGAAAASGAAISRATRVATEGRQEAEHLYPNTLNKVARPLDISQADFEHVALAQGIARITQKFPGVHILGMFDAGIKHEAAAYLASDALRMAKYSAYTPLRITEQPQITIFRFTETGLYEISAENY